MEANSDFASPVSAPSTPSLSISHSTPYLVILVLQRIQFMREVLPRASPKYLYSKGGQRVSVNSVA